LESAQFLGTRVSNDIEFHESWMIRKLSETQRYNVAKVFCRKLSRKSKITPVIIIIIIIITNIVTVVIIIVAAAAAMVVNAMKAYNCSGGRLSFSSQHQTQLSSLLPTFTALISKTKTAMSHEVGRPQDHSKRC
jgi:hypothetical protein